MIDLCVLEALKQQLSADKLVHDGPEGKDVVLLAHFLTPAQGISVAHAVGNMGGASINSRTCKAAQDDVALVVEQEVL